MTEDMSLDSLSFQNDLSFPDAGLDAVFYPTSVLFEVVSDKTVSEETRTLAAAELLVRHFFLKGTDADVKKALEEFLRDASVLARFDRSSRNFEDNAGDVRPDDVLRTLAGSCGERSLCDRLRPVLQADGFIPLRLDGIEGRPACLLPFSFEPGGPRREAGTVLDWRGNEHKPWSDLLRERLPGLFVRHGKKYCIRLAFVQEGRFARIPVDGKSLLLPVRMAWARFRGNLPKYNVFRLFSTGEIEPNGELRRVETAAKWSLVRDMPGAHLLAPDVGDPETQDVSGVVPEGERVRERLPAAIVEKVEEWFFSDWVHDRRNLQTLKFAKTLNDFKRRISKPSVLVPCLTGVILVLALTVVCLVVRNHNAMIAEQKTREMIERQSRDENERLQAEKEAFEKRLSTAEEELAKVQEKAERAKDAESLEKAKKEVEAAKAEMESAKKAAEEAQAKAKQAEREAAEARKNAEQAKENADKAKKGLLVGEISRIKERLDKGRSKWDEYLGKAKESFSAFNTRVEDRTKRFKKGIESNGSHKFDKVRELISRIQSEVLTDEKVVRTLIEAAAKDGDTGLTNKIEELVVGEKFKPECEKAFKRILKDEGSFVDDLNRYLSTFNKSLVEERTNRGFPASVQKNGSALVSPGELPPSVRDTIDKSAVAVARRVQELGKTEIAEMTKILQKKGNPKTVAVSALAGKLRSDVGRELEGIVRRIEEEAVRHACETADQARSAAETEGASKYGSATPRNPPGNP